MNSVSYVVTVYNKERCIRELVEGLKNQIGEFEREYIFVDDGSTDDSLNILNEETKALSNVTIISHANIGPARSLNAGITVAAMKYIYLMDGDDRLIPEATQILLDAIDRHKVDIAVGKHFDSRSRHKITKLTSKETVLKDPLWEAVRLLALGSSRAIVRSSLIKKVGGSDERVFTQDYTIALRLSRIASFVVVDKLIATDIYDAPERLSNNKSQEVYDSFLARYLFIKDNLDLDYKYKHRALQIQLRESAKWYFKRNYLINFFSKHRARYWISKFNVSLSDEKILLWMRQALEAVEQAMVKRKNYNF